jgi:hypothetical protein
VAVQSGCYGMRNYEADHWHPFAVREGTKSTAMSSTTIAAEIRGGAGAMFENQPASPAQTHS